MWIKNHEGDFFDLEMVFEVYKHGLASGEYAIVAKFVIDDGDGEPYERFLFRGSEDNTKLAMRKLEALLNCASL